MKNVIPYILIFTAVIGLLHSCAQRGTLTGGPRDETPPRLDTALSMDNYITNFKKQDVELYFDEFIEVRDASKQILISPPLIYPPTINSRLKRLRIGFDEKEELKDDATYVINFGKSIRDFTEGNELINYSYVFSTGDYIDSLSISGTIVDVKTGEGEEDIVVMLYVEDRDSIVYEERPFYFARTDDKGVFKIENLRADTFKLVAIEDQNLNYTFDPLSERIGFSDSLLYLTADSISGLRIEIWKEQTTAVYSSYEVLQKGKISLTFEGSPEVSDITIIDSVDYFIEKNNDNSLILWYQQTNRSRVSWTAMGPRSLDTISARINQRTADTLTTQFAFNNWNFDKKIGLHPLDTLSFSTPIPISMIDSSKLSIIDTAAKVALPYTFKNVRYPERNFTLQADWPADKTLSIVALPGAMTDFYGRANDTLQAFVPVSTIAKFGKIEIKLSGFDSLSIVMTLMKDDKEIQKVYSTLDVREFTFEKLVPGTYSVSFIIDRNGNQKWDPGNYLQHLQAEKLYTYDLESLREDWVLEVDIDYQKLISKPSKPKEEDRKPPKR